MFAGANWSVNGRKRVNSPFSVRADGSVITLHEKHIGGHPEWAESSLLIGRFGRRQVVFDFCTQRIVDKLGDETVFPNSEGDIVLSLDGKLFVNGFKRSDKKSLCGLSGDDGVNVRSEGVNKRNFAADIRIDSAPRCDREGDQILFPGIIDDGKRQLVVLHLIETSE